MNTKLTDMADRIRDAYNDTVGEHALVAVVRHKALSLLAYYRPSHDVPDNGHFPTHGRVVVMMLNGQETKETHPFRAIFVDNAAEFNDERWRDQSIVYESGEEENVSANLYEYLIERKPFRELTFDLIY